MSQYIISQNQAFVAFQNAPSAVANPMSAHISGGHAYLCTYANTAERPQGLLGFYQPAEATVYPWPNRPAGGLIDSAFTKLWIQNALLKYFDSSVRGGSFTKTGNNAVSSKAGGGTSATNFKAYEAPNGLVYSRDASLNTRDVRVGDVVRLTFANPDVAAQWTTVKGFLGDIQASVVDEPQADGSNPATQMASVDGPTQVAGTPINCIGMTADGTGYSGVTGGYIETQYRITVITGSTGNWGLARLQVVSSDGGDDVASLAPAAIGVPFAIGTRGLMVTLTDDTTAHNEFSEVAESEGILNLANDLVPGQAWDVTVNQAFTVPTPTDSGTYTGAVDTAYVVQVSRGGTWAENPQITVTTTNGTDFSGPTTVAKGVSAAVGTQNVSIKFDTTDGSSTGLVEGAKWYIDAHAAYQGPMRTLLLANNIAVGIDLNDPVEVTLFIENPLLQVPQNRAGYAPLTNWDMSETDITVNSGIIAYDSSWLDSTSGAPLPLPVISEASMDYGDVYVEFRAWLPNLAYSVGTVSTVAQLNAAISGDLTPRNPLKQGVYDALLGSNGSPVTFTAVTDPTSPTAWR